MPRGTRKIVGLWYFLDSNYPKPRKKTFTAKEKAFLRPIAETLAMMDGNAFFGMMTDDDGNDVFYEQYLPEAYQIFKNNGGLKGWAGQVSWIKQLEHENDGVKEAYQSWQLLKVLSKNRK